MVNAIKKVTPDDDELLVFDAEFLAEEDGGAYVASTMFSAIFIPGHRVPKEILDPMTNSQEELERQLLAEIPLYTARIAKPYWAKGANQRDFDAINVSIYGSICLTGDRHALDSIIANGSLIYNPNDTPITLRQATDLCNLEVDWDFFNDQSEIDRPLRNRTVYFHVQASALLKSMGLKPTKPNKKTLIQKLNRLALMTLELTFEKDGVTIPNRSKRLSLIDKDFHLLLNRNVIRNQSGITHDTFTDILIGVNNFYLSSLNSDGSISRTRFLNDYPNLLGIAGQEDFFKHIDSNRKFFYHGRFLSDVIYEYFEQKMSLFGMNLYNKTSALYNQVIKMQPKLKRHCGFIIKPEHNPNKRIKGQDYRIYYLEKMEQDK